MADGSAVRHDIDSLHVLPLDMLPLQTQSLRAARMIKNVRLESVIEISRAVGAGSLQLDVGQLPVMYSWPAGDGHPDCRCLRAVAQLPSYDVYSLRIQLRRLGIEVDDWDAFRLSPDKAAELTTYMVAFTRPLVRQIYGHLDTKIESLADLIVLFTDPDRNQALRNLKTMADKLRISVVEVPKFLEDYGDVFLSLAYYRSHLDDLNPKVDAFERAVGEMVGSYQLRNDRRTARVVGDVARTVRRMTCRLGDWMERFDRESRSMWEGISAESFAAVRKLVERHHIGVGGVLCGLSVKMQNWEAVAGKSGAGQSGAGQAGGVTRQMDYILSDLKQGLDQICDAAGPELPDGFPGRQGVLQAVPRAGSRSWEVA